MTETVKNCMKCGASVIERSRFCSSCGSSIKFQNKIAGRRFRINRLWILFTIITVFIFEYIFATFTGQFFLLFSGAESMELETGFLVSSAGSVTGIFFGSMFSAYWSPGISNREVLIGAAAEIIISQVILLIIASVFTPMIFLRTAIIMAFAWGGVKTGEIIQKKARLG